MKCLSPQSVDELGKSLAAMTEQSVIIAGGTDCVIRMRCASKEADVLLYPGRVEELHRVELTENELSIGAMVTMTELEASLVGVPEFRAIADAAGNVGSPQIRNKATVVGNLCNASPAGDMLPVCWLFGAEMELLNVDGGVRRTPVDRFILGSKKTALSYNEIVLRVCIDRRRWRGWVSSFVKIGSRERVSISRVSACAAIKVACDGTVENAAMTLGSIANTPICLREFATRIVGKKLTEDVISSVIPVAARCIHEHCRPANRHYKTNAAKGLVTDVLDKINSAPAYQTQRDDESGG